MWRAWDCNSRKRTLFIGQLICRCWEHHPHPFQRLIFVGTMRAMVGVVWKQWSFQGTPGWLSGTQVRFQVSVHKSGSLTNAAWPSSKLTFTPHVRGSGAVGFHWRGALAGGREPCLAMVATPIGSVGVLKSARFARGGEPVNKFVAGRSLVNGQIAGQVESVNNGVETGKRTLETDGKLKSSGRPWPTFPPIPGIN